MDAMLARLKKEVLESLRATASTAEAVAVAARNAADTAAGLVKKQEEIYNFMERYGKLLTAELVEIDAEDERERQVDVVNGVATPGVGMMEWFAQTDDASLGFGGGIPQ